MGKRDRPLGTGETPVSHSCPLLKASVALAVVMFAGHLLGAEPLLRVVDLEIGETAFFPATNVHECTLIERGYREVLVSWLA